MSNLPADVTEDGLDTDPQLRKCDCCDRMTYNVDLCDRCRSREDSREPQWLRDELGK